MRREERSAVFILCLFLLLSSPAVMGYINFLFLISYLSKGDYLPTTPSAPSLQVAVSVLVPKRYYVRIIPDVQC